MYGFCSSKGLTFNIAHVLIHAIKGRCECSIFFKLPVVDYSIFRFSLVVLAHVQTRSNGDTTTSGQGLQMLGL
jgi:hypothetical protein